MAATRSHKEKKTYLLQEIICQTRTKSYTTEFVLKYALNVIQCININAMAAYFCINNL